MSIITKFKFLLLYLVSWIVLFDLARIVFLLFHFGKSEQLDGKTILLTFLVGLRMDLSMACYILLPVCLFVMLSLFIPFFKKPAIYKTYTFIILFFVLLIVISDLEVFKEWGFRLDATPLKYLQTPKEALASISHLPVFLYLLSFAFALAFLFFLYGRFLSKLVLNLSISTHKIITAVFLFLFTVLLIIPMRGGLQLSPLNQSSVYFSHNNYANIAAINATWNFLHGVLNEKKNWTNFYKYLPEKKKNEIIDSLYKSSGQTEHVIDFSSKPNVIFVIWESFTEKVIHTTLNGKQVTPHFNQLKTEGIYFSNIYASGDRTDRGIPAILSGYPALPIASIIHLPAKSSKLSSLPAQFKQHGYKTAFFYGGEPEFANIKSYLLECQFGSIVSINDFNRADLNSKWGAHDGVVMNRMLSDMKKLQRPFFVTWLTLSSHEPFETPVPVVFTGDDISTKFMNSLHYTDECIYNLVQECKKQTWWKNTLLVIIADHGHRIPETGKRADDFKIPMLWLGGALNKTGIIVDNLISQVDLAASISMQILLHKNDFPFSKNIFDSTTRQWAFFAFNNGFGFIQPDKRLVFDNVGRRVIMQEGDIGDKDIEAGKALQQYTFEDFLKK